MHVDPSKYIWWLISRSAGIVALCLISLAVLIGLMMSTKILRRPGLARKLMRLHEHTALVAMAAIVVHGAALLGDTWLRPGLKGLIVPFMMGYRPLYTGLGIIAAYLAGALGLSFYVRRRIGPRLWRKLHRATALVWVLGVVHTIGAGSDASTLWLRAVMLVTGAPIVFLLLVRILHHGARLGGIAASTAGPPGAASAERLRRPHATAAAPSVVGLRAQRQSHAGGAGAHDQDPRGRSPSGAREGARAT